MWIELRQVTDLVRNGKENLIFFLLDELIEERKEGVLDAVDPEDTGDNPDFVDGIDPGSHFVSVEIFLQDVHRVEILHVD